MNLTDKETKAVAQSNLRCAQVAINSAINALSSSALTEHDIKTFQRDSQDATGLVFRARDMISESFRPNGEFIQKE